MDINYTYIYELVEEDTGKIFYIGKSNTPHTRFSGHRGCNIFKTQKFYMRIVKKYYDIEDEMIKNYINEGHELVNKRKNDYLFTKEYNVGDIIKIDPMLKINNMFNNQKNEK